MGEAKSNLKWYDSYDELKTKGKKYAIGYEGIHGWRYVSFETTKDMFACLKQLGEYKAYQEIIKNTAPQKIRFCLKTSNQDIVRQFVNTILGSRLFKSFLKSRDIAVFFTDTEYHVIINNYYMVNLQAVQSVYKHIKTIFPGLIDKEIYREGYPFLLPRVKNHKNKKVSALLKEINTNCPITGLSEGDNPEGQLKDNTNVNPKVSIELEIEENKITHKGTRKNSLISYTKDCKLLEFKKDRLMVINNPSTYNKVSGPSIYTFLGECCQIQEGAEVKVDDLYTLYIDWCNTRKITAYSKNPFCKEVNKRGFKSRQVMRDYERYSIFQGICRL